MKSLALSLALLAGIGSREAFVFYCEPFNKVAQSATKTGLKVHYQATLDCDGGFQQCCYCVELTLIKAGSGFVIRTTPRLQGFIAPTCGTAFVDADITAPAGTVGVWTLFADVYVCDVNGHCDPNSVKVGQTFQKVFSFP
jgi:hypothetical protein